MQDSPSSGLPVGHGWIMLMWVLCHRLWEINIELLDGCCDAGGEMTRAWGGVRVFPP